MAKAPQILSDTKKRKKKTSRFYSVYSGNETKTKEIGTTNAINLAESILNCSFFIVIKAAVSFALVETKTPARAAVKQGQIHGHYIITRSLQSGSLSFAGPFRR